ETNVREAAVVKSYSDAQPTAFHAVVTVGRRAQWPSSRVPAECGSFAPQEQSLGGARAAGELRSVSTGRLPDERKNGAAEELLRVGRVHRGQNRPRQRQRPIHLSRGPRECAGAQDRGGDG